LGQDAVAAAEYVVSICCIFCYLIIVFGLGLENRINDAKIIVRKTESATITKQKHGLKVTKGKKWDMEVQPRIVRGLIVRIVVWVGLVIIGVVGIEFTDPDWNVLWEWAKSYLP